MTKTSSDSRKSAPRRANGSKHGSTTSSRIPRPKRQKHGFRSESWILENLKGKPIVPITMFDNINQDSVRDDPRCIIPLSSDPSRQISPTVSNFEWDDIKRRYDKFCRLCMASTKYRYYVNPFRYDDVFEVKQSNFPCLGGGDGLFAKIHIPAKCILGAYTGVFIRTDDAAQLLNEQRRLSELGQPHSRSSQYILGQIQIRNQKTIVRGYLDPTNRDPNALQYIENHLSKINSPNFETVQQEQQYLASHPGLRDCLDYISTRWENCKKERVSCGNVDCYFIITTKNVNAGDELIFFYGGIWKTKFIQMLDSRYARQGGQQRQQRQSTAQQRRPPQTRTQRQRQIRSPRSSENRSFCIIS